MFPFLDWLNDQPEVGYSAYLRGSGGPPGMRRYFGGRFDELWREYEGLLGQQAMSGQDPTLKWTDFLTQTPFTARYARLSPQQRGESTGQFNPYVRWMM